VEEPVGNLGAGQGGFYAPTTAPNANDLLRGMFLARRERGHEIAMDLHRARVVNDLFAPPEAP
jgi:hypothetical protein